MGFFALSTAFLVSGCGGSSKPFLDTPTTAKPPVAIVGGQRIARQELLSRLSEAAGARVLEEIILDQAIADEIKLRGISITDEQLAAEEDRLIDLLSDGLDVDADTAANIETRIRNVRGLGPKRWASLVRRSASLRLLVADQVDLSETALRLAHQQRYGTRYEIRLLQTSSRQEIAQYRDEIVTAPSPRDRFSSLAADHSTDLGARGTLITISPLDPRVPEGLRKAADSLTPGNVSGVIAINDGYALVWLETQLDPDGPSLEESRDQLEALVRLRQERLLMESEARSLLLGQGVTVFDPSLAWAWDSRELPR